jgi:hypothetical protein
MADEPDEDAPERQLDPGNAAGRGPEDDAGSPPELADLQKRAHLFSTNFNAPVTIRNFGGAEGSRPGTKKIDGSELLDTHRHFVAPDGFVEMARRLRAQRLLVLSGEAQTGRRCAALALLTRSAPHDLVAMGPLVELAPGTTPAALLEMPFERSGRYLLDECRPDDAHADRLGFDLTSLQQRLRTAGAVLVATSSAPALASHSLAARCTPVDCGKVLDEYLKGRDLYDEQTHSRLRHLATQRRPWEMKALFEQLERGGPDAVDRYFHQDARDELRQRVSEKPNIPVLLPLAAAALLPGVGERSYEAHLHRLHELVDVHARRGPWTGANDETLPASRADRPKWVTTRTYPFDLRERSALLVEGIPADFVLAELWRHYGHELWGPVYDWLAELPDRGRDIGDELALATGMATVTQVDPVGANRIVAEWARNDSLKQRMAAAATLSALSQHEATAGDALRRAVVWSKSRPRLRIVAAMAFGQSLSRVFPVEAMSHLWYLCFGNPVVATSARRQFVALLWTAGRDDDQVRRVLSIVEWQLEQQLLRQGYRDKSTHQAVETVSKILSAPLADGGTLTLHVLRRLPDQLSHLGRLWAEVLRSWPHRMDGLHTLYAAYDALEPTGAGAFIDLGGVVRQHVSAPEWGWLCRDLAVPAWTTSTDRSSVDNEVSA